MSGSDSTFRTGLLIECTTQVSSTGYAQVDRDLRARWDNVLGEAVPPKIGRRSAYPTIERRAGALFGCQFPGFVTCCLTLGLSKSLLKCVKCLSIRGLNPGTLRGLWFAKDYLVRSLP